MYCDAGRDTHVCFPLVRRIPTGGGSMFAKRCRERHTCGLTRLGFVDTRLSPLYLSSSAELSVWFKMRTWRQSADGLPFQKP